MICFSEPENVDGEKRAELIGLIRSEKVNREERLTSELIEKLKGENVVRISHENGNLYHQRRRYADGELIFLVNSSMDEKTSVQLAYPEGNALYELDALTGKIYTYPANGKGTDTFEVEPARNLLLFIRKGSEKNPPRE